MIKLKKKYLIKVPRNIFVTYCDEKNLILISGPFFTRFLKLRIKIFLELSLNSILIGQVSVFGPSKFELKKAKKMQGTTVARIKQAIVEVAYVLYRKLCLKGVGYKFFSHEILSNQVCLKIGYSHFVYLRVPESLNLSCRSFSTLFIFGNYSFDGLTRLASQIKDCKSPDFYKGKGILNGQEEIKLRAGKKI